MRETITASKIMLYYEIIASNTADLFTKVLATKQNISSRTISIP